MKTQEIVKPTQKQLIELGLSQSYASELTNGRKMPSLRVALKIQHKLGYPVTAWRVDL